VRIQVNGESREVPQEVSLRELMTYLALPGDRVAIELNEKVVRHADWSTVTVEEGDRVEIVQFVGGGAISLQAAPF
jgi:thiamine biosynthesis protein ThiS